MRVDFNPIAEADLESIRRWIARDNPVRALSFVGELKARALALSDQPRRHPVAFETALGPIHKMVHGRYLIYYRVLSASVVILHIRHSAQDTPRFD